MHFSISTYAEILALVVSVVLYRKLSPNLKAFFFLLLLVVFVELGSEFKLFTWKKSNNWIYNISTTIEFFFYGVIFYRVYYTSRFKSFLPYLFIVLIGTITVNVFLIQGITKFHSYTFMLGSLLMIICALHYFYQGIRKDVTYDFTKDPFFWISIAILQFYAGEFMIMMFYEYLAPLKLKSYSIFFRLLMDIINVIEYGLFSFAFIIEARKNTRISFGALA